MDRKTALLDWATKLSTTDQTPPARPFMQPGEIVFRIVHWFASGSYSELGPKMV